MAESLSTKFSVDIPQEKNQDKNRLLFIPCILRQTSENEYTEKGAQVIREQFEQHFVRQVILFLQEDKSNAKDLRKCMNINLVLAVCGFVTPRTIISHLMHLNKIGKQKFEDFKIDFKVTFNLHSVTAIVDTQSCMTVVKRHTKDSFNCLPQVLEQLSPGFVQNVVLQYPLGKNPLTFSPLNQLKRYISRANPRIPKTGIFLLSRGNEKKSTFVPSHITEACIGSALTTGDVLPDYRAMKLDQQILFDSAEEEVKRSILFSSKWKDIQYFNNLRPSPLGTGFDVLSVLDYHTTKEVDLNRLAKILPYLFPKASIKIPMIAASLNDSENTKIDGHYSKEKSRGAFARTIELAMSKVESEVFQNYSIDDLQSKLKEWLVDKNGETWLKNVAEKESLSIKLFAIHGVVKNKSNSTMYAVEGNEFIVRVLPLPRKNFMQSKFEDKKGLGLSLSFYFAPNLDIEMQEVPTRNKFLLECFYKNGGKADSYPTYSMLTKISKTIDSLFKIALPYKWEPKMERVRKDVSEDEVKALSEKFKHAPLPSGYWYDGKVYLDYYGCRYSIRPDIEDYIQEYLKTENSKIQKENDRIMGLINKSF